MLIQEQIKGLAGALIRARAEQGLSVGEVARRARVAPQTVYAWEAGEHIPGLDNLKRWAEALGFRLSVDVSMTRVEP